MRTAKVPDAGAIEVTIVEESGCPDFRLSVNVGALVDVVGLGPDLELEVAVGHIPFRVAVLAVRSLHHYFVVKSLPFAHIFAAHGRRHAVFCCVASYQVCKRGAISLSVEKDIDLDVGEPFVATVAHHQCLRDVCVVHRRNRSREGVVAFIKLIAVLEKFP